MIRSQDGRVELKGPTEELIEDLTYAMAAVLMQRAKCRDRKRLAKIGSMMTQDAIKIIYNKEKSKDGEVADNTTCDTCP